MKIIGAKFVDEEEKSSQERQQNLEDKHKEENELAQKGSAGSEEPKGDEIKLEDETVLNYIKTKYEKEIDSIEDLFKEKVVEKVVEPELPEPVKKFMDFQKETGRGFGDFLKYQRDIDSLPDEEKLVEYYLDTNEGFDKEDAKTYIEMNFGFDEDMDDESEIKKKKLKMKQELGKAKKHLQEKSEKYKAPTESVGADFTKTEEYQQYQQFLQQSQSQNEVVAKRAKIFNEGTNQLFSEEFKGFDFEVEEGQALGHLGCDVVKMGGFPADHTTQTHNGIVHFLGRYPLHNQRKFESARNPENFNFFGFGSAPGQRVHGSLHQFIGNKMVVPGYDQCVFETLADQLSLVFLHLSLQALKIA